MNGGQPLRNGWRPAPAGDMTVMKVGDQKRMEGSHSLFNFSRTMERNGLNPVSKDGYRGGHRQGMDTVM